MSDGFLHTKIKSECFGCEACIQACSQLAIFMQEDEEGFRYPVIELEKCIRCGRCNKVCPKENMPARFEKDKYVFGGYLKDEVVRDKSTSGGAFSAVVEAWCDQNYVIFGAAADGVEVYHTYITDKKYLDIFRKSKYSQSRIGTAYADAKTFLKEGKKVLFSGTPCHIAGLKAFLEDTDQQNLLTIEVVCEGVPSPWYVRKYNEWCKKKYGAPIEYLDYRYKDSKKWDFEVMETRLVGEGKTEHRRSRYKAKWDFQVMLTKIRGGVEMKTDRWFNPFWSIWLNHLMSRPSCYKCPFANTERVADITLGDLWGVHLYCPELYGKNGGASLVVCSTEKGKQTVRKAASQMYGHELDFITALKYQSPLLKPISYNPDRAAFMTDLTGKMDYDSINKKWAKSPGIKLLWQKYVWGNRQTVALWNLKQKLRKNRK